MFEKLIRLFIGAVLLVAVLKYPWFLVSALQSFVDVVVRTADAIVHLKLAHAPSAVSKP
jgi:hypothetical protein